MLQVFLSSICMYVTVVYYKCLSNRTDFIFTCSLDLLAHVIDAAVQPVKDTYQASNSFLAKLHSVLEVQGEFFLTAVLQRGQEAPGILT